MTKYKVVQVYHINERYGYNGHCYHTFIKILSSFERQTGPNKISTGYVIRESKEDGICFGKENRDWTDKDFDKLPYVFELEYWQEKIKQTCPCIKKECPLFSTSSSSRQWCDDEGDPGTYERCPIPKKRLETINETKKI